MPSDFTSDNQRRGLFSIVLFVAIVSIQNLSFTIKSLSSAGRPVAVQQVRTAYVVSTNATSKRYKSTVITLQHFGFAVRHIVPQNLGDDHHSKVISNKLALLEAFGMIAEGAAPWGYVFEDDIRKHEMSKETFEDLLKAELTSELFMYLGICQNEHISPVRSCGKCSHAMGASKGGANEILKFSSLSTKVNASRVAQIVPSETSYLDTVIQAWCLSRGGFALFGPGIPSSYGHRSHFGMFVQDRRQFPSLID